MLRRTQEEREFYSAGFVKLQVEFISTKPGVVKELIRLAKYWNSQIAGSALKGKHARLPSSYSMELITVLAWGRANNPYRFDRLQGFKAVLNIIAYELSTLRHYWTVNYSSSMAERALQAMDASNKKRFVFI